MATVHLSTIHEEDSGLVQSVFKSKAENENLAATHRHSINWTCGTSHLIGTATLPDSEVLPAWRHPLITCVNHQLNEDKESKNQEVSLWRSGEQFFTAAGSIFDGLQSARQRRCTPVKRRRCHAPSQFCLSILVMLATFPLFVHAGKSSRSKSPMVLVLDVDNTLYNEQHAGIEQQIVQHTHNFCQEILNMSPQEADELFHSYGSTVEGLRHSIWKDLSEPMLQKEMERLYHYVYDSIDPSGLLTKNSEKTSISTGYSHDAQAAEAERQLRLTRRLLQHTPHSIVLASNSPSWHVQKVLCALGMATLPSKTTTSLYTPDRSSHFFTKHQPRQFFATDDGVTSTHFQSSTRLVLMEDSLHNLKRIQEAFLESIEGSYHIQHHDNPDKRNFEKDMITTSSVAQALMYHHGLLDPGFTFSDTKYLEAKNKVDAEAIHAVTWNHLMGEITKQHRSSTKLLWIVDVGAGILSMLDLMLNGNHQRRLSPLDIATPVRYTAYESNRGLYPVCHERLLSWGFELVDQASPTEMWYRHPNKPWEVQLLLCDFVDSEKYTIHSPPPDHSPTLIVGCCFADLMDPEYLTINLIRTFGLLHKAPVAGDATLLYFPITFAGVTQFLPAQPFQAGGQAGNTIIPSDTVAFRIYSHILQSDLGHNLEINRLIDAMQQHGAVLLAKAPSNWRIDSVESPYLYQTMLYFFGNTAGPELIKNGFDGGAWIQRARSLRPVVQVTNKDLLFQIGPPQSSVRNSSRDEKLVECNEILFTEAYHVESVKKELPPQLGPRQVLIRSLYSLISSGTELKIFKGDFENDAALDVNIEDMEGERMAYPLSYGYSLVGQVVECGSDVDPYFQNKLVFTFSPHATHVVTDVNAVQIVPDGIDAQDAIFMPSVETALSLVHDAHVRLGENVAVYGQGLIGLLVTALLGLQSRALPRTGRYGIVTTFDTIADRLAISADLGASEALFPGGSKGPFDVSIEVSGNGKALQAAIDNTRDGGRIIVGSWYGNSDVQLKLGIDFHRSHKSIQTSQVSEIPALLSRLWSKSRRFSLTWELVKEIRPSRLLTKILPLDQAQTAYETLDLGNEIAVAFDYTNSP